MCLLAISSLVTCLFRSSAHFSIGFGFLFVFVVVVGFYLAVPCGMWALSSPTRD